MLYSVYAVLGVCCMQCMLYAVYAVLGICCTRCMLYSVYAVLGVNSSSCHGERQTDNLTLYSAIMVEFWIRKRDGEWRWEWYGEYKQIWQIKSTTCLMQFRRSHIGVITRGIGSRTCSIGNGKLTCTCNSLTPRYSWWVSISSHLSLSRPQLYYHFRTQSQVVPRYHSMPWFISWNQVQHTLSTACTEYSILRAQHTLSAACTEYCIHWVLYTPSTAYTKYYIHQVLHTLSTAYTKYRIHWVLHILSIASSQDGLSPAPSQPLTSQRT